MASSPLLERLASHAAAGPGPVCARGEWGGDSGQRASPGGRGGALLLLTTVGTPGTRRRSLWRGGIAAPETAQCRLYQRTQ